MISACKTLRYFITKHLASCLRFSFTPYYHYSPTMSICICSFHVAGLYFYIEASGQSPGETASLESPYIQSNGNATCMVFYYHLYGHSIGSLRVKVGDQILWQLSGNQGDSWYKATVPLNFDGTFTVG